MEYLDVILVFLLFLFNYLGKKVGLSEIIGIILFMFGLGFWITARIQLGDNFSVKAKANKLITKGLYAKVKNPIYLFASLAVAGAVLPSRSYLQYAFVLTLVVVEFARAKKEQKVLLAKFDKKYLKYKSKTWF